MSESTTLPETKKMYLPTATRILWELCALFDEDYKIMFSPIAWETWEFPDGSVTKFVWGKPCSIIDENTIEVEMEDEVTGVLFSQRLYNTWKSRVSIYFYNE